MATALKTTLRHLSRLFRGESLGALADVQLLERYAASKDGEAFEALVARHGPMVAATCRAVLSNEQDVEDAFQATFFVLVSKANSIRAGEALGAWLHRVAMRTALEAGRLAKRRRLRESDAMRLAVVNEGPSAGHAGLEPDARAIVHEEIERLPDRQRRSLVLCDLEGLSYDAAARQLHCTIPAIRCGLAKGRKRLRARLVKRGVTLTLGGLLEVHAASIGATTPSTWAHAAVRAATRGTSPAVVARLTQSFLRRVTFVRLAYAVLVLGGLGVLGAASMVLATASSGQDTRAVPSPSVAEKASAAVPAAQQATVTLKGRVIGPDGRPVGGATVRIDYPRFYLRQQPAPASSDATSGDDGWFSLAIPRTIAGDPTERVSGRMLVLNAFAPGFGPGRAVTTADALGANELTIKLVTDKAPLEGRVVDIQGRPVAAAEIKAFRCFSARNMDLAAWIAEAARREVPHDWREGLVAQPLGLVTQTDRAGRFRLVGIGADRIAELEVTGATIGGMRVVAMTRDGEELKLPWNLGVPESPRSALIRPRRFELVASSSQPIKGIVRDARTQTPIAGLKLRASARQGPTAMLPIPFTETTTDVQGRYRLSGVASAPSYVLTVEPQGSQPYLRTVYTVPGADAPLEPVKFDAALKRAVIVRGRVIDELTGKPAPCTVEVLPAADNLFVAQFPGWSPARTLSDPLRKDGRFEIATVPGRAIIACRSDSLLYRLGSGAEKIQGFDPKTRRLPVAQYVCYADSYHAFAEVDLDPETDTADVEIKVSRGQSLEVHVEDPDARPLGETLASGLSAMDPSHAYFQPTSIVEVHAYDPARPRALFITHDKRKLIRSILLSGEQRSPLTVRLEPWGEVKGRIVDGRGRPRSDLIVREDDGSVAIGFGGVAGRYVRLGGDGRFRIAALIPRGGYRFVAQDPDTGQVVGQLGDEEVLQPGEVRDLGDISIAR